MTKTLEKTVTTQNSAALVSVTVLRRNTHCGVTLAGCLIAALSACTADVPMDNVGPDAGMMAQPDAGQGSNMLPTGPFALDCSTVANQTTPHCARPDTVLAGSLGTGPAIVASGLGDLNGGFIEGSRLVAAVAYSTSSTMAATGSVVAVDLATGDRTVISGTYKDAATGRQSVGSGPDWGSVNDVQPGPDGWYAITALGVYRVDPATGARTLVIDSANTATRCTVGTTKVIPRKDTLAIGPDKSVYLALSNSPAGTGVGLVAVKAGVCRIVSLGGGPSGSSVGSGATMTNGYFRSVRFQGSKIWALEFVSKSLMTVDPASGSRVRVSATGTMPVGSGTIDVGSGWLGFAAGGAPVYTTLYDVANRLLTLGAIDPTNGARTQVVLKSGPANKGGETYPPLWIHPTKPWLLVGIDNAIVQVDIATGASYTLSR